MAGIQQSQAQEELLKKAADKAVSTVKTIVGDSARTIVIDDRNDAIPPAIPMMIALTMYLFHKCHSSMSLGVRLG